MSDVNSGKPCEPSSVAGHSFEWPYYSFFALISFAVFTFLGYEWKNRTEDLSGVYSFWLIVAASSCMFVICLVAFVRKSVFGRYVWLCRIKDSELGESVQVYIISRWRANFHFKTTGGMNDCIFLPLGGWFTRLRYYVNGKDVLANGEALVWVKNLTWQFNPVFGGNANIVVRDRNGNSLVVPLNMIFQFFDIASQNGNIKYFGCGLLLVQLMVRCDEYNNELRSERTSAEKRLLELNALKQELEYISAGFNKITDDAFQLMMKLTKKPISNQTAGILRRSLAQTLMDVLPDDDYARRDVCWVCSFPGKPDLGQKPRRNGGVFVKS